MTSLEWLLLLVPTAIYLFYRWSVATFDYFEKRGVPFVKPVPLLGGMWNFFSGKMHMVDAGSLGYEMFPDSRFSGFFAFRKPGYLIHDPELVKQITIKDFDHFADHTNVVPIEADPVLGRALFFTEGTRWKHGRSGLSPAFTGSKMRNMFALLSNYTEGAMGRLVDDARRDGRLELEMRDLFQKLGNDVTTSLSFGVEIDSVHNPNNEFMRRGKELIATDGIQGLKFLLLTVLPKSFFRTLRIRIFPKEATDFYVDVISKTIKQREEHNIVRPDFIHLLVQGRKNELKMEQADDQLKSVGFSTVEEHLQSSTENSQYSDLDITAAAASFFFGGLETTTTVICFALYEMSQNPNVKQKLQAEIDQVKEQLSTTDSKLSYEVLQNMKYLDMVVSETLRRWAPLGLTNRACTKPYTIEDNNGTKVTIQVGDLIQIPIQSIHRDHRFYPNPYKFDPERFSEENKANINRSAFLPFGSGPRNCIGSRLALMQTKCFLYYTLANFELELCPKTDVPIKLNKRSVSLHTLSGFWFRMVPRGEVKK
uniref:Cytochrome P450 n=1 Tax=Culex quinquefasciatus TaxID=7176 RepID=K7ZNL6_CULQU|nr:cytochrome P450 [Culex quinquefasciatus]